MFRRFISMILSTALLTIGIGFRITSAQTAKQLQATEKVRAAVLKMGVGPTSRVKIKLRDKTELKGYVGEAGQDAFTVITDEKTGTSQTLSYAEVAEVNKPGGGPSTRTWIILGGVAAAAVVVGRIVKPALCDGGAQNRFPC